MASQNLVFVLLPNGILPAKTLSLSVYLTPRLQSGNTLAAFPDFLDWAGLVKDHGLTLTFGCAGKTHAVPVTQGILRSDVWQEIFKKDTYVEPYKIPDFDQRLIVSYPVREATSFLKYAYQCARRNPRWLLITPRAEQADRCMKGSQEVVFLFPLNE